MSADGKYEAYNYIKNIDYTMINKKNVERYNRILKNDIYKLDIDEIKSTGYVVDTLEAGLWILLNTETFN